MILKSVKSMMVMICVAVIAAALAGCGPKDTSDYWRRQVNKAKDADQKKNAQLMLAQALDNEKRYDEAIKEYDAVIATKDKKYLFLALNNKGRALFNSGKNEEALVIFTQLLKMDHEKKFDTVLHGNIAMCYHKMKQFDKALAAYNKALELKPDNKEAQVGLGYLKQDMQAQAAEEDKANEASEKTGTATGTEPAESGTGGAAKDDAPEAGEAPAKSGN